MQHSGLVLLTALSLVPTAAPATPDQPHYHRGKLSPYEIGPPSILLSRHDEERLAAGETLMQVLS